jgi:hypothetical protein
MPKRNKKQLGGDGYVINVNESIGGLPAYSRYSNNYKPIFDGELLQNGGDGYTVNASKDIGGMAEIDRYTYIDTPVFEGDLLKNGGGDCGCGNSDPTIFDLIKQSGGKMKKKTVTQFSAIKVVSNMISQFEIGPLIALVISIFLKDMSSRKPRKTKQLGGYIGELKDILAPLGKNNLVVLASLLLLHHFAVEKSSIKTSKNQQGGDNFNNLLSNILAPLGLNSLGTSVVLVMLQQAYTKKNKSIDAQYGGNPLKDIIAPLGTNAFIATGLLIVLEKMFINKVNEIESADIQKKNLIGGRINKTYEKLFNLIAPITFNIFATESFLKNMALKRK